MRLIVRDTQNNVDSALSFDMAGAIPMFHIVNGI